MWSLTFHHVLVFLGIETGCASDKRLWTSCQWPPCGYVGSGNWNYFIYPSLSAYQFKGAEMYNKVFQDYILLLTIRIYVFISFTYNFSTFSNGLLFAQCVALRPYSGYSHIGWIICLSVSMLMMGNLCHCTVAFRILRKCHKLQNCSNDSTTTSQ